MGVSSVYMAQERLDGAEAPDQTRDTLGAACSGVLPSRYARARQRR